ncbi:hypothetical protein CL654_02215 [bacterium]|nr:hypothetical protein [bacterium]|tara:strand:- start:590 stop:4528 length:3939 start_codon:yes stop_codon:yes gene_type:complete
MYKKNLSILTIGILGALASLSLVSYVDASGPYVRHQIAAVAARNVEVFDFDEDGDMDVISGASTNFAWYENNGTNLSFTRHLIDSTAASTTSMFDVQPIDFDEDGDIDVVMAAHGLGITLGVYSWYENDGTDTSFTFHEIDSNLGEPSNIYVIDFDEDGDLDVLGAAQNDGEFAWYQNDGSDTSFTKRSIDATAAATGAAYIEAIDFDEDGDIDVVAAADEGQEFMWYQNDGTDLSFTRRSIDTSSNASSAWRARPLDFDKDGDLDVVTVAKNSSSPFAWYENDGTDTSFTRRAIGSLSVGTPRGGRPVDFDNDGDFDFVAGSLDDELLWFENDGSDTSFTSRMVEDGTTYMDNPENVVPTDFDDDGDIDFVVSALGSSEIAWYESKFMQGTAYSDEGSTALGSGKTVALSVSGGSTLNTDFFTTTTASDGTFSFSTTTTGITEGAAIAIYLDGETEKASAFSIVGPGGLANLDLYQNHILIKNDNTGTTTNTIVSSSDTSDSDDLLSISGGAITVGTDSDYELYIPDGYTLTQDASITVGDSDTSSDLKVVGTLDANNQNMTVYGDLLIDSSLGSLLGGSGTITVSGDWTDSGNKFTDETSTVILDGTGTITTLSPVFYNLNIGSSGQTTTLSTSVTVDRVLTFGGGTITDGTSGGNGTFILRAAIATPVVDSGTSDFSGISFEYDTTTQENIVAGVMKTLDLSALTAGGSYSLTGSTTVLGNLPLNPLSGTKTLNTAGHDLTVLGQTTIGLAGVVNAQITISGDSSVTFGALSESNGSPAGAITTTNGNTLTFTDDLTLDTAGTLIVGTSTIIFAATSTDQTIEINDSFYNLTINNTGASGSNDVIFVNNVDVDNNLTITDGDLDIDTNNVTLTVGEDITIGSGGSYTRNGEAFTIDGTTTYTDNSGAFDLGDLTVSSSTAVASLTLASNATSSGLTIASGETFSLGSNNLYLTDATASATPLTVNGTFTPGTGTVTYKATSTQTTIPVLQYYNLALDGGASFLTSAVTTVLNSFTNLGGYLNESTGYISASSTTSLNQEGYTTSDSPTITVLDGDANTSATSTDSFTITTTLSNGDTETVTLTETGSATGIFTGSPSINTGSVSGSDGALNVPSGSTILTATFTDTKESTDVTSDTATITNTGGTTNTSASSGSVAALPPSFGGGLGAPTTPTQPSQPSTGSGLTSAQVTSIITLLTSFNVDQATLDTVRNILQGNTSPTGDQTFTVSTTNLTGPFRFNTTSSQTRLLQQILAQDTTIYPEGLTTGYYGSLTRKAVGKFQERHNLAIPTDAFYGYAGPQTRATIKQVFN